MNRRQFLQTAIASGAAAGLLGGSEWGGPVLDIHLHPRLGDQKEIDHLEGTDVSKAVLLPGPASEDRARAVVKEHPSRFVRFTNADVRKPEAIRLLRTAVENGALGFGELKYPVLLDGPEMKRVYDLAADLHVPVLIHFQENDFNSGFRRLPAVLKQYPRTTFIAHANSWWAHISADVDDRVAYPTGPIKPGGLSDRMLSDYPNIYGDLSANSGRNAMTRDPEFAAAFVARHRNKLLFGSDCGCRDGHGADQPQAPLNGKCTAQETLSALKRMATPEVFRSITWENGTKLLKL
jgi:predicted TIM-barrel fold metal-dependent hydrolase